MINKSLKTFKNFALNDMHVCVNKCKMKYWYIHSLISLLATCYIKWLKSIVQNAYYLKMMQLNHLHTVTLQWSIRQTNSLNLFEWLIHSLL